jgi:CO/xanthine dehydrogenase Mo-binding subunit
VDQTAAEAKQYLVTLASAKLGVPVSQLAVNEGVVSSTAGASKSVSYSDLLGGKLFNAKITGKAPLKDPGKYKIVGQSVPRFDIPDIVSGKFLFVQQLQLHGTLYGRVVRPPTPGATLVKVNGLKKPVPGFVKYVQKKDWLGVIAKTDWAAIQAATTLDVEWSDWSGLPGDGNLHKTMRELPLYNEADNPQDKRLLPQYVNPNPNVIGDTQKVDAAIAKAAKALSVTYNTPFLSHGSIGPSAASAQWDGDRLTVWTSTQTPYGTREALAKFWGLPNNNVRLVSQRGSGTYGQNGSDDSAFDASIMAQAVNGTPVHVQWMRWDEFRWENYKSARIHDMTGALDSTGKVVAWKNEDWGFTQYGRPEYHEPSHGGEAGSLIAAQLAGYEGPSVEEGGGPQPESGYDIS